MNDAKIIIKKYRTALNSLDTFIKESFEFLEFWFQSVKDNSQAELSYQSFKEYLIETKRIRKTLIQAQLITDLQKIKKGDIDK